MRGERPLVDRQATDQRLDIIVACSVLAPRSRDSDDVCDEAVEIDPCLRRGCVENPGWFVVDLLALGENRCDHAVADGRLIRLDTGAEPFRRSYALSR